MIIKMITSAAFVVVAAYWGGSVMMERDRCLQIDKAAAPVRVVMSVARKADSNFELVADPLTWLSWSVKIDEMTQQLLVKAFYGDKLSCKGEGPGFRAEKKDTAQSTSFDDDEDWGE